MAHQTLNYRPITQNPGNQSGYPKPSQLINGNFKREFAENIQRPYVQVGILSITRFFSEKGYWHEFSLLDFMSWLEKNEPNENNRKEIVKVFTPGLCTPQGNYFDYWFPPIFMTVPEGSSFKVYPSTALFDFFDVVK